MNAYGRAEVRFIGVVEKVDGQLARLRVYPEYCAGLRGVEDYSHLIVLYWLHMRDNEADRHTLLVFPRRHACNMETGVFACRSPSRPNPIGLCVVELVGIDGCILTVRGLDAVEGSPLVDIKPYSPRADAVLDARVPDWVLRGPPT